MTEKEWKDLDSKYKKYISYEVNRTLQKFRFKGTEEIKDEIFNLDHTNCLTFENDKLQEFKITECQICGKVFRQRKRNGLLMCKECSNKYKEILESLIDDIKKDLNIKYNEFNIKFNMPLSYGYNCKTQKHTIFSTYIDDLHINSWFDTKILALMIKINSSYLKNIIEEKIKSDFYITNSWYDFNHKKKITTNKGEK